MNTVDEKEPEASDLADAAVRKAVEEVKTSEKEVPDDLVLPEEDGITTDQIEESAVAKDFRIILDVVKYWRAGENIMGRKESES